MFSAATVEEQKYLKMARQKDNLLFHILLLMNHDSEKNYIIDAKHKGVIDEAMALYVEPSTSKTLSLIEQRRQEYEAMTPQEKEIRNKAEQKLAMEYYKMLPENHLDILMGSQDNEPF
jgi:hypothetical protein